MLIEYENRYFVIDPEIDFIMADYCYYNGGNCWGCTDAAMGDCPCDEVTIEELLEHGNIVK